MTDTIKSDNSAVVARLEKRIAELEREKSALQASRMAYASEFDDDVGSIHENIRKLKRERDLLKWNHDALAAQLDVEGLRSYNKSNAKQALARRDARVAADVLDDFVYWAVDRCNNWHRRGGTVTAKEIYGEANRWAHKFRSEAEGGE